MNYDLAKKLKEAGFSQSVVYGMKYYAAGIRKWCLFEDLETPIGVEWYRVPTLSELIEACGTSLQKLERAGTDFGGPCWAASALEGDSANGRYQTGQTPEEAVANLWLALNAK